MQIRIRIKYAAKLHKKLDIHTKLKKKTEHLPEKTDFTGLSCREVLCLNNVSENFFVESFDVVKCYFTRIARRAYI